MRLPLERIRVVDLSIYLPGPLCTQLLADFGAEVIKVEPPGGEWGRTLPPFLGDQSARFYTVNRNKKSIRLNLKTQSGRDIFKKLITTADVIIEQYRPGTMDKLGLGYKELKKINERLIYCALTGYGYSGPYQYIAGHNINYMSLAGLIGLTGPADQIPATPPVQIGGAHSAIIAILLALQARSRTGQGQFCDVAILDEFISTLPYLLGEWSGSGQLPARGAGDFTGAYACYNIYETGDQRFISLGAVEEKYWVSFCIQIGKPEYTARQWEKAVQSEMINTLRSIFLTRTQQEWIEFFAATDVCLAPVLTLEEMSTHPQVIDRDMIIKLENFQGTGKDMYIPGIAIKLSATPGKAHPLFPEPGEHTAEILEELGYPSE